MIYLYYIKYRECGNMHACYQRRCAWCVGGNDDDAKMHRWRLPRERKHVHKFDMVLWFPCDATWLARSGYPDWGFMGDRACQEAL